MPHSYTHALVRPPAGSFTQALSSQHLPIELQIARAEHNEYCQALRAAGLTVEVLPPDERYPDSCFMQDPALVIQGHAIIGRMGVPSRAGETELAAEILAPRFPLTRITAPDTLEGGDVMILPGRVLVGESARTNAAGIQQLRAILAPLGLPVINVPISGYLHLLSAAEYVGKSILLATEDFAGHPAFAGLDVIIVPPEEAYAVNVLTVGDNVILPTGHPRVAGLLQARSFNLFPVPMSQFAAADGGVTCLSLVW